MNTSPTGSAGEGRTLNENLHPMSATICFVTVLESLDKSMSYAITLCCSRTLRDDRGSTSRRPEWWSLSMGSCSSAD